jgi:hypothetical protein
MQTAATAAALLILLAILGVCVWAVHKLDP